MAKMIKDYISTLIHQAHCHHVWHFSIAPKFMDHETFSVRYCEKCGKREFMH